MDPRFVIDRLGQIVLLIGLSLVPHVLLAAPDEADKVRRALAEVEPAIESAGAVLGKRFGDLNSLPRHIGDEYSALKKEVDTLGRRGRDLREKISDADGDYTNVRAILRGLEAQGKQLDREYQGILNAKAKADADYASLLLQISTHNAKRGKQKTVKDKDAYEANGRELNRKLRALYSRKNEHNREVTDFKNRAQRHKETLKKEQKRRDKILYTQSRNTMAVEEYIAACRAAVMRARALHEIAPHVRARPDPANRLPPQSLGEALATTLGPAILKQLGARSVAGGAGHVLTLLDIAAAGVHDADARVQRKILLFGEYADAMETLKRKGRLRAGDPGYEALRQMMKRAGTDVPTTEAEFAKQAFFSLGALGRALNILATGYVSGKLARLGHHGLIRSWRVNNTVVKGRMQIHRLLKELIDYDAGLIASDGVKYGTKAVSRIRAKLRGAKK